MALALGDVDRSGACYVVALLLCIMLSSAVCVVDAVVFWGSCISLSAVHGLFYFHAVSRRLHLSLLCMWGGCVYVIPTSARPYV